MKERIVILIDMDCFYVQVEERDNPNIKGKPAAVVQYNTWKGGGIIAVNYEARDYGIKRGMRGDDAKDNYPEIELVQVPVHRGKANLTKYRQAGREVIKVLSEYSNFVERASIDEAYIELTDTIDNYIESNNESITSAHLNSTYIVPDEQTCTNQREDRAELLNDWISAINDNESPTTNLDFKLAFAAKLCEEMRKSILEKTGFKCSAGISVNKMLAKLACGLHKPNRQTVLKPSAVANLWKNIPIGKIRLLGGKLGDSLVESCGCQKMSDLASLHSRVLRKHFDDKTVSWLEGLGKGIDSEPVRPRQNPKSVGCSKNFVGKDSLNTKEKLQSWLESLTQELNERLEEDRFQNKRNPKNLTVSVNFDSDSKQISFSKSSLLQSLDAKTILNLVSRIVDQADNFTDKFWFQNIRSIGISAGKFENVSAVGMKNIQEMFTKQPSLKQIPKTNLTEDALIKEETNRMDTLNTTVHNINKIIPSQSNLNNDKKLLGIKSFFKKHKLVKMNSDMIDYNQRYDNTRTRYSNSTYNEAAVNCSRNHNYSSDSKISSTRILNSVYCDDQIPSTSKIIPCNDETSINTILLSEQMESGKIGLNEYINSVINELPSSPSSPPHEEINIPSMDKLNDTLNDIEYEECDECHDTFPKEYLYQHKDYHFAVRLRNEQLLENSLPKKTDVKRNSIKRKLNPLKICVKSAKIDNYFTKI